MTNDDIKWLMEALKFSRITIANMKAMLAGTSENDYNSYVSQLLDDDDVYIKATTLRVNDDPSA